MWKWNVPSIDGLIDLSCKLQKTPPQDHALTLDALTPESSIDPVQTLIDRTSNVPQAKIDPVPYAERRTRRGGSQQRDNADRR
jgi:hypothetical protein